MANYLIIQVLVSNLAYPERDGRQAVELHRILLKKLSIHFRHLIKLFPIVNGMLDYTQSQTYFLDLSQAGQRMLYFSGRLFITGCEA